MPKVCKIEGCYRVILCEKCHIKILPIINRYIAPNIVMYLGAAQSCKSVANHGILIHPNNINLIHIGRARVNESIRCLVLVKMYGNKSKKLFVKIMGNNEVRMNEFPLFSFPFLKIVFIIVFISWCSLFINKLTIILFCDGINQILLGISRSPIAVLVHEGL